LSLRMGWEILLPFQYCEKFGVIFSLNIVSNSPVKCVFFVGRFLITHSIVFLTEVSLTFYEFHKFNFFNR